MRRVVASAAVALLAASSASAADSVGMDAGGMQVPLTIGGKKVKRTAPRGGAPGVLAEPSIPQMPGSGPIVAPNTYLQLPERVQPRSMAYAPRRRAVLVTDGNPTYQRTAPGIVPFLTRKEPPVPYAYVIDGATARCTYNMAFHNRKALPYGIAEDPRDGRVVVTFHQAQTDNVEVWQPDLSWKLTYHDVSLKPSIPFFYGGAGEMWIPFTISDRYMEEGAWLHSVGGWRRGARLRPQPRRPPASKPGAPTRRPWPRSHACSHSRPQTPPHPPPPAGDRVLLMYIFRKDGQREETFPRRMWNRVKMPHTVRVDGAGRVWAAGLTTWAWDDGVHGPTPKQLNETAVSGRLGCACAR